jgi:hypothetical protein
MVNKQYNLAAPNGLVAQLMGYQRRRIFASFMAQTNAGASDTILDVGAAADRSYASSNYIEQWYPSRATITAVGIDDAAFLTELYPGVRFVRASGLALPFKERAFDLVHSSAVLEHVGSFARQLAFVRECCRVAARGVFLTTPNRWFPVEVHTQLPLVHWLPKPLFGTLMRGCGLGFFADEANLNLLTARELRSIAAQVEGFSFKIASVSLGGWPSNLLLIGRRGE